MKAGVWYVISSVLTKAIFAITTPIFTRLMTTEEYGVVSTFTSWHSLLLPLFTLNLMYSIGRAKLDYPEDLDGYIGSMQLFSAVISAALSIAGIMFLRPVAAFLELNELGTVLLLLYLSFEPAILFYQNGCRYRYRYKQNIAIAWYIALASAIPPLALLLTQSGDRPVLYMAGVVVPIVILSVFFWLRSIKSGHVRINLAYWKHGFTLSAPLILHSISMQILSQSDRLFIRKIYGEGDTGIYSLAYMYGLVLTVITTGIAESWLPWFQDTFFEGRKDDIRRNIKPLVVLGCYIGLASIAFAPEAMLIMGGEAYLRGVGCVPPIVLGVVCQFIYTHYVNIEMLLKKTLYVSYGTIFSALLNVVLNAIFIPRYGFVAAAYTTLASYLTLLLAHFIITKKILKVSLYDDIFMFAALLVTALASGILMTVHDHAVIRYALTGVGFVTFLIYFRDYWRPWVKKIIP